MAVKQVTQVIFFPNRGFLGDKVLYEPIIRAFTCGHEDRSILGIEWCGDQISMMEFPVPPRATFVLHNHLFKNREMLIRVLNWLKFLRTSGIATMLLKTIHTESSLLKSVYAEATVWDLWGKIGQLAGNGLYPLLKIPEGTQERLELKLKDYSLELNNEFVVIHLRSLGRDNDRNLDFVKYLKIAHKIVEEFGFKVVFIAQNDDFYQPITQTAINNGNMVVDLRDRLDNIWETACLMSRSYAYIGGDSGPTHLAAAVGARIITVERDSPLYGPFTESSRLIRLAKDKSSVNEILEALRNFSASPKTANQYSQQEERHILRFLPSIVSRNIKMSESLQKNLEQGINMVRMFTNLSTNPGSCRMVKIYNAMLTEKIPNSVYIPMRVGILSNCIPVLRDLPICGFSVSQPFKIDIMNYVDEIDTDVAKIGAANTVVNNSGYWKAYNTDWQGAVESLKKLTVLKGKTAIVFGGGVASRAICYGLKKNLCNVIVCCRSIDQAKTLWSNYGLLAYGTSEELLEFDADIFVNATPLGSHKNIDPNTFSSLVPRSVSVILDVVFEPEITALNILANSRGCSFADGWDMLVNQAFHQINVFASYSAAGFSCHPMNHCQREAQRGRA